ncbi:hypothetical protein LJ737_19990 [Hymenobacter sp. 15J16-1T3B]|uniref:hypothetical protein n=1 Tax=Hymenobacter sp. 15J16-1T3B TaxID=2886941 RepID=UPI001D107FEC|nr:hypothetical protein [Hymenobacter sp. 15J16-1T3B]MCC3159534.1 hypothetical protein [Hymenobacter sp. 15J16-1T3B]
MPLTHYAFRALGLFDQCFHVLDEGQFLQQRTTADEGVKLYHMPGGNQGNAYNITRFAKTSLLAARRTPWRIAQPPNVRRIPVGAEGAPTGTTTREAAACIFWLTKEAFS